MVKAKDILNLINVNDVLLCKTLKNCSMMKGVLGGFREYEKHGRYTIYKSSNYAVLFGTISHFFVQKLKRL